MRMINLSKPMRLFPLLFSWFFATGFFLGAQSMSAQKPLPRLANNIIYGEIYGVGGNYSVNYERVLFRALNQRLMVSASIGGSHYFKPLDIQEYYFLERLNVSYGYKGWFLEAGSNVVLARGRSYGFLHNQWSGWTVFGTFFPHFGLRYQRKPFRPFFKTYIFPIHNVCCYNDFFLYLIEKSRHGPEWYWWGGFSAGLTF